MDTDSEPGRMDTQQIIEQARRMLKDIERKGGIGVLSEATELIRQYGGERSCFLKNLSDLKPANMCYTDAVYVLSSTVKAFIRYVENGLLEGVSIERKAQIDVVSDFLSQAQALLDSNDMHPAAPAMIIGASLEKQRGQTYTLTKPTRPWKRSRSSPSLKRNQEIGWRRCILGQGPARFQRACARLCRVFTLCRTGS
jgi:hypothetical protein